MPRPTLDEIITQGNIRYYYQPGGANAINQLLYAGQDGQYINIDSNTHPKRGSIAPINVQDLRQAGKYRQVSRNISPPDFASMTVNFLQKHSSVPKQLIGYDCLITFYQLAGRCKDLSDFINGWDDYIKIMPDGLQTNSTEGGGAFAADDMIQDALDFTIAEPYPIGKMQFGETGEAEVDREVIDIVYGSQINCPDCGPGDDGTQLLYAVLNNDVAVPPDIVFSTDGGKTWTLQAITGTADSDIPVAIDVVGNFLIVVVKDGATGAYFTTQIDEFTGVPSTTWAKSTPGFDATGQPNDIYVANPREIYFAGDAGFIYRLRGLSASLETLSAGGVTSNDLNRVHGIDDLIVFVGDTADVVISVNGGQSFSLTNASPGAANLTALWVNAKYNWWVGDSAGAVYFSNTEGRSWVQATMVNALTQVDDIVFPTPEVGYIIGRDATPNAIMYHTFNGGVDLVETQATEKNGRVLQWSTFDYGNRMAFPDVSTAGISSNYLAIGGLADDGTDGIILVGAANIVG